MPGGWPPADKEEGHDLAPIPSTGTGPALGHPSLVSPSREALIFPDAPAGGPLIPSQLYSAPLGQGLHQTRTASTVDIASQWY